MTAGHCIQSTLYSVRLGEYDLNKDKDCDTDADSGDFGDSYDYDEEEENCADPVQDILIESSVAHSDYNKGGFAANDIGLVKLARPANISANNVKIICLPITENLLNLPERVIVTGFGATEGGIRQSNELLQAAFPIYPLDQCYEKFKKNRNFGLTDKQVL